jgi:hypothetical protein
MSFTDEISGEMELTFMNTFCMGGNLRSLFSTDMVPEALMQFKPIIDKACGVDSRGLLMSDLVAFAGQAEPPTIFDEAKQTPLSPATYLSLLGRLTTDDTLNEGVSFVNFDCWTEDSGVILSPNAQPLKEVKNRVSRVGS